MESKGIIELNAKDMLYQLCRKWRTLLICALCGIILMAGLSWTRPIVIMSESSGQTLDSTFEQLSQLKGKLSGRELNEVRMTVESYLTFRRLLLYNGERSDDSILLKLNPHMMPSLSRSYAISNYETGNDYPTDGKDICDNIAEIYKREIRSSRVVEDIRHALNDSIDAASIQEILNVTKDAKSIVSIRVYGTDREQCETIMSVIDKYFDDITKKAQSIYSFDIALINDLFEETENTDLYKTQQDQANNTATIQRNLMTLPDKLVEGQKTYYDTAVSAAEELLSDGTMSEAAVLELLFHPEEYKSEEDPGEAKNAEVQIRRVIRLKYLVVGAFLALFLAAAWILFRYIVSTKLKNKDEVRWVLGTNVLGTVKADSLSGKKKPLQAVDAAIDKLFLSENDRLEPDKSIELICNEAYWWAVKNNTSRILVTGSCAEPATEEVKRRICSGLNALNEGKVTGQADRKPVEAFMSESAICSVDAKEKYAEADSVIFVERVNGSSFNDIGEEIELYKRHGIAIIGTVVVA